MKEKQEIKIPVTVEHHTKRIEALIKSPYGTLFLVIYAFVDSLIPIPFMITDPFLMVAVLAKRQHTAWLVFITSVSSVLGGVVAYAGIYYFREYLLLQLSPEWHAMLDSIVITNNFDTFTLSVVGAVTPIPYMLIAWAVALTGSSLTMFILGSLFGRLVRYGIVGWCTYKFGSMALAYAKRSIMLTSIIVLVVAALYLVWHVS
jgi:membrane protein YqaA with SNARE-associated domain